MKNLWYYISEDEVAPDFTQKLENTTVKEGGELVLQCCVTGTPPPKIEWLKDGQKISDRRVSVKSNDDGTQVLKIRKVVIKLFPNIIIWRHVLIRATNLRHFWIIRSR